VMLIKIGFMDFVIQHWSVIYSSQFY